MKTKLDKEIGKLAARHANEIFEVMKKRKIDEGEFSFHYDDAFSDELGKLMNGD